MCVGLENVDEVKPILLAEDIEDDAGLLQTVLKQAGVMNPVFVVPDGQEAIAYLSGEGVYADRAKFPIPVVLLLDLKMPKRTGFDVLAWCKRQPHLTKLLIIVLSGNREIKSINQAYRMGADTFLLKPCHVLDVTNLTRNFKGYWTLPPQTSL
jgi:CheY-like chemotaxis protein